MPKTFQIFAGNSTGPQEQETALTGYKTQFWPIRVLAKISLQIPNFCQNLAEASRPSKEPKTDLTGEKPQFWPIRVLAKNTNLSPEIDKNLVRARVDTNKHRCQARFKIVQPYFSWETSATRKQLMTQRKPLQAQADTKINTGNCRR